MYKLFYCVTGIVNQLLSSKVFIPFSKLTYCAYLVNPFVIQSIRFSSETTVHLELLPLVSRDYL